jgi:hypothetical protein
MPANRHLDAVDPRLRGRDLGIGVGGHDRFRGVDNAVRARLPARRGQHAVEFRRVERLADDAGRGEKDFASFAPVAAAAILAVSATLRRRSCR